MDFADLKKLKRDIVFKKLLRGNNLVFHTTWGLFSPKDIDEGTRLLIDNVKVRPNYTVLDLGCGYGALGLALAKLSPKGKVHLIDKDFVAIEYAKKNSQINNIQNCQIYLSNGFSNVSDVRFDVIASNIPAKVGKELYWILMLEAKKYLKTNGKFYLVFISGLKEFFKRNLKEIFGNYQHIANSKTYTVLMAVKE